MSIYGLGVVGNNVLLGKVHTNFIFSSYMNVKIPMKTFTFIDIKSTSVPALTELSLASC